MDGAVERNAKPQHPCQALRDACMRCSWEQLRAKNVGCAARGACISAFEGGARLSTGAGAA
jgi:hypothetical protein